MRILALVLVATLIPFVPPARAASYVDLPVQETGIVDWVQDGDTFRFVEDGQSGRVSVRLLGINAPEVAGFNNLHYEKDYCGGLAAAHALKEILPIGTRVQLRSLSKGSMNRGRIQRSAFAFDEATGEYDIDVQAAMARTGLVMWFTVEHEPTFSADYRRIIDEAQRAQIGIWDPGLCGPIEQGDARIALTVHWDAPGDDVANRNGEYVIVRNIGTSTVDLSGWLLRDSSIDSWFTLPGGSVLVPGDSRVVHVGDGTPGQPRPRDLYMRSPIPMFPNPRAGAFIGDGAYLLDRSTAYRAWSEYPCLDDCSTDPALGTLVISAINRAVSGRTINAQANSQTVTVRNPGRHPVLLDDVYLRRNLSTFSFVPGTVLGPGRSIRVHMGRGVPTAMDQYWGETHRLLSIPTGSVELRSVRNALVSRRTWG